MSNAANIINHIGLVLDASSSMQPHASDLVKVADSQIKHLAIRSKELEQETRISVWSFADANKIQCLVWDMDVLRLPSMAKFYKAQGNTAFIDATMLAIRDLAETPERYGDHSFLLYVLTDGEENASRQFSSFALKQKLASLPAHWTMAALVPNAHGVFEAKKFGFPEGNIQIWDTKSDGGVQEIGERVQAATDAYMTMRGQGVRSTTSLFRTDAATVNTATIRQAGLTPVARDKYLLIPVPKDTVIKTFTEECGHNYRTGNGFYELSKRELIQPQKKIAIVERGPKATVYVGQEARQMIGLGDTTVSVKPDHNPDFRIFVQSQSNNRKLMAGTKYLYML